MNRLLFLCGLLLAGLPLVAQDAPADAEKEAPAPEPDGWKRGAGIGLDFAQLLQINPKQGAGQNRLGFGSAVNYFANMKKGRTAWETNALWQFGLQRLGSGLIAQGTDEQIPFQKSLDELRLNSKYGVATKPGGNLFWTANFSFLSQLTPTYQFPGVYSGNFISDFIDQGFEPLSKLFSPATINFAVGIDYKPTPRFSVFFSPIASKFIMVLNDTIAARGVHGNPVEGERGADGLFADYNKVDPQLGALAQLQYELPFADEKGAFSSNLKLYSNYLRNPQNVDVDWANAFTYKLFKNFQLTALVNVFYDDDVLVQITDNDAVNGVSGLGKRVSITQQLLLTYARTF